MEKIVKGWDRVKYYLSDESGGYKWIWFNPTTGEIEVTGEGDGTPEELEWGDDWREIEINHDEFLKYSADGQINCIKYEIACNYPEYAAGLGYGEYVPPRWHMDFY